MTALLVAAPFLHGHYEQRTARARAAEQHVDELITAVRQYRDRTGRLPERLEDAARPPALDRWKAFDYARHGDGSFTIRTSGQGMSVTRTSR